MKHPENEDQTGKKEMEVKPEAKKNIYSSNESFECKPTDYVDFQSNEKNCSNSEKITGECNLTSKTDKTQIEDSTIALYSSSNNNNHHGSLELINEKGDTCFKGEDLELSKDNSIIFNSEKFKFLSLNETKLNNFDEDFHRHQNTSEMPSDIKTVVLEKSEKCSETVNSRQINQSNFEDSNHLIEKKDNKIFRSAQKFDETNYSKEILVYHKNSEKIFGNDSMKRREEIKELLDNISLLKSRSSQNNINIVTKLLNSKGVYNGMLTELPLYEELLKYLLEKRNLSEERFESNDFEDNELLFDQFDDNFGTLVNRKKNNIEIYSKRRTVFEGIVDFAVKRICIDKYCVNQLERPKLNYECVLLKPLNAYLELFNRDSIVFFEDTIVHDEYLKTSLIPFQANNKSLYLSNASLNYKIDKVKKEIDIVSGCLIDKEWKIFEKSIEEFKVLIKNLEKNGFNLLKKNSYSYFQDKSFGGRFNEVKLNGSLKNLDLNDISIVKVSLGSGIRYLKESLNDELCKKLEVIERRLDSLNKFLLLREESNEELNGETILSKLQNLENMLQTIIPKSHLVADNFQTKIKMENSLLNGFVIGDIRKSDLKKISNLVKSKVSSYAGRRSSKYETERCNNEINETESYKTAENEQINSLLKELDTIGNKESIFCFDDFPVITARLIEKESIIEFFLSTIERFERFKSMHIENQINLEKIQGITSILLDTMKANIKKFD
ncbi:uncharacterized protein cubi_00176 [Cryptosporidium ubiquitum]|uniref:Uncharacterized protein n=1 Tax=Cryptosporidium ubiquitum TaxID=857276 RepID=A0A1J4MKR5_9CRYT|nr:uncharacterized protein cubi_00176 [Cryptosporidium ubiquitum]OII74623.1 hypothetical protein cubi_00176 [Cryptosporidium ubiquitum]